MPKTFILTLATGMLLFVSVPFAGPGPTAPKPPASLAANAAGTGTNAGAASGRAPIDWKKMDQKQRKAYMKTTIVPAAQKLFAEYDPKKFRKVNCFTCHGSGVENGYKMPSGDLPKLPATPAGFAALQHKKPDAMKFMATKVKPAVAALLGLPEFIPGKQEGFGCHGCHAIEDAGSK